MQRPDEKKRQAIVAAAARLFAAKPYHKVRLDDVAAAAKVGKGTLYVYFEDKDDLYFSLIYDGFDRLVGRLKSQLAGDNSAGPKTMVPPPKSKSAGKPMTAAAALKLIVDEAVAFAFAFPHFFHVMRAAADARVPAKPSWVRKRKEWTDLIVDVIRRGVAAGELDDPAPELTASCLGGMVRSVMMFGPKGLDEAAVAAQLYRLLARGIVVKEGKR